MSRSSAKVAMSRAAWIPARSPAALARIVPFRFAPGSVTSAGRLARAAGHAGFGLVKSGCPACRLGQRGPTRAAARGPARVTDAGPSPAVPLDRGSRPPQGLGGKRALRPRGTRGGAHRQWPFPRSAPSPEGYRRSVSVNLVHSRFGRLTTGFIRVGSSSGGDSSPAEARSSAQASRFSPEAHGADAAIVVACP